MFRIPEEDTMRKEELGGTSWLNAITDPNHVPLPSPLTSQSSPLSPFPNGFPLWGNGIVINNEEDNVDVLLSNDFSGMGILDDQGNGAKTRGHGVVMDSLAYTYPNATPRSYDAHAHNIVFTEEAVTPRQRQSTINNVGSPKSPPGVSVSQWAFPRGHAFVPQQVESSSLSSLGGGGGGYGRGVVHQLQKPSFASSYPRDRFVCSPRGSFVMESDVGGWGAATATATSPFVFSQTMQQPKLGNLNLNNAPPSPPRYNFPAAKETSANRELQLPQSLSPRRTVGDPVAFKCDNSFIIHEKDMKRGCNSVWGGGGGRKYSHEEVPLSQLMISRVPAGGRENSSTLASDVVAPQQPLLLNFGSLAELQGYMFHMAKDQNGCRFLQRMVDEGDSEDMEIVFQGVVDNVVELMMDPFGNYLVQKLLDVCRDDQKLQIVLMLTREPGQLIRTSLNTHGTRVVQRLIATLKSRKEISLVRSAIQPGFLDLIKDLNGNHVIQRCLQCLSCQDNEFIFDAAAKFCVDIATHQHGCCVLQRCIDYSMGKSQDRLVKEICKHGLLLAQDPYGNYVVQYIIEMDIPSATAKLIAQFKGNYVSLSMQKFSSHVVEKCLKHVAETRSRVVQELLSVPHFERLLQDPYANYVVQRALSVTKGSLHASLVEAVRPHKILKTSPYCKRIFSRNLLKK